MSYTIRFLDEVADELGATVEWYEQRSEGVGLEFERDFFASVALVSRDPQLHQRVYGEFQRILLKRFPYALWFRMNRNVVVFVLLFHGSRNPATLRRELKRRWAHEGK